MCHFVAPANVKRATVVNCRPMTSFIPCATLRHRAGAWLSLLAMLLVFAGPLIGQGMSQARAPQAALDDICGGPPPGIGLVAQRSPQPSSHHLALWEKCGYCSLLFQHPALADSHTTLFFAGVRPLGYPSATFSTQQAVAPVFPGWCPRLTHPANRGRQLTLAQWRQGTSVATPCVAQRLPRGPFT